MRTGALSIATRGRRIEVIPVDIAESPAEMRRGLSFRAIVTRAMVFPHYGETRVVYTFRDTLAPLDILVADESGVIRDVVARIEPQSPDRWFGGYPVSLVVELPAGWIARHDLRVGDRVVQLQ